LLLQYRPERDWVKFGEIDPYFGVLSRDAFKSENLNEAARAEFFQSGVWHVANVLEIVRDCFGSVPSGVALDFGCGVGRITTALARHFDRVVGLDISDGMIVEAKKAASAVNLINVEYDTSLNKQRFSAPLYDFVHTFIVLQHIPTKLGESIIADLLQSTKVGGVGVVHFTYDSSESSLKSLMKRTAKRTFGLRQLANVLAGRRWNYPAMQMNNYVLANIFRLFDECKADIYKICRIDDWGSVGLMIFYKKMAADAPMNPWTNPVRKGEISYTGSL